MKKKAIIIALFLILLSACSGGGENPGNYPYEPDTPAPDPHDGVFVAGESKMTFDGDGERVYIELGEDLAELFGLQPRGYSATYVFLSGELPPNGSIPSRYDVAHELQISFELEEETLVKVFDVGIAAEDGSTATVGTDMVTEDRIPFLFKNDDGLFSVIFEKR